jgi:thymidylate kinase
MFPDDELVGPKGTGKSTLSNLLAKRLRAKLDVKRVHYGKPPASWLSFVPRMMASAVRKPPADETAGDQGRRAERRYSTKFIISKLLVGYDRQRLLKRITREVSSGTIVISDRCPVTNATGMDGSAFDDLAITRARSPFQRWLMERERAIYRCLPRPRLVVKLSVPIETALKRDLARSKPEGPLPNAIKRRWALESESEFARSIVCEFDTEGELDDTFRAVAARVWEAV